MKKSVNIVTLFLLVLMPLSIGSRIFAQDNDEFKVPTMQQLNDVTSQFETITSDDYDSMDDGLPISLSDEEAEMGAQLAILLTGGFLFVFLFSGLILYVFFAITQKKVAEKLGFEKSWHAWVPILSTIQLFKMGDQNPWLILLVLIPGLGEIAFLVLTIIIYCRIAEKLGYEKLLGLLALVPFGLFIMWGMFAWGKKGQPIAPQTSSFNPGTLVDANPAPTILPLVEEQPVVPQYAEPTPQPAPTSNPTTYSEPTPASIPQPIPTSNPNAYTEPIPAPIPQPTSVNTQVEPVPTQETNPQIPPLAPQTPPTPVVPSQM